MGENEQGGMLRVVTVLGLIAIIAAVVIYAVTGLKGTSTAQREAAVSNVTRAQMNSRNLLLNSKTLGWGYGNNNYVNVTTENYDSTMKMWHLTSPQSNLQYVGVYWYQPGNTSYQLVKGDQWAFSFDIKGTGVYHIVGSENSTGYKGPTGDVSTGWRRVSKTITFWLVEGGQWTIGANATGVDPNGKLLASNIKFENGDEATGYYVG